MTKKNVLKKCVVSLVTLLFTIFPAVGLAAAPEDAGVKGDTAFLADVSGYQPNSAEEEIVLDRINSIVATTDDESTAIAIAASAHGHCSIARVSSTKARIAGTTVSTTGYKKVIVTLQRYKDGKWQNYPGANVSASNYETTVSTSGTFTLTPGYSYRAFANHVSGATGFQSISGSLNF